MPGPKDKIKDFILLTSAGTNRKIWVNYNHITAISGRRGIKGSTRLIFGRERKHVLDVLETEEEVMEIIK